MKIPPLMITREHGSWAVLLIPMIIGCTYAGSITFNVLFLLLSSLGIFMSYVPLQILLRKQFGKNVPPPQAEAAKFWAVVYLAAGMVFLLPLLFQQLWLLLPIGGIGILTFFINFFLLRKGQRSSVLSDFIAVCGLTLSGPSTYYILTASLDMNAFVIWSLNVLFFGCSVFYVQMKIRATGLKKNDWGFLDKISIGKWNIIYHGAVFVILNIMVFYHLTISTILAAYIPMMVHSLYGTMRLQKKTKFKNLGFGLLTHSLVFGLIILFLIRRI